MKFIQKDREGFVWISASISMIYIFPLKLQETLTLRVRFFPSCS